MKEYRPTHVGTVTKYVFVESPDVTPEELALRAYEISKGMMIKETCFGLQVTGKPDEVDEIIRRIREFDPSHIFVKDRGFPPGDPRRCRANLGGARPGFHGHEYELPLLRYVSHGLEVPIGKTPEPMRVERKNKLEFGVLKRMMESQEP
ncbi:MAG: methanogenesis marker 6 protein [Methanomicrobiales archaeon]|nr:methanogenesis marker 6 protein [Methanomicrobiales archaeon]